MSICVHLCPSVDKKKHPLVAGEGIKITTSNCPILFLAGDAEYAGNSSKISAAFVSFARKIDVHDFCTVP